MKLHRLIFVVPLLAIIWVRANTSSISQQNFAAAGEFPSNLSEPAAMPAKIYAESWKDGAMIRLKKPQIGSFKSDAAELKIVNPRSGQVAVLTEDVTLETRPFSLTISKTGQQISNPSALTYKVARSSVAQEWGWKVFRPQFSPTGRFLLFKFGIRDSLTGGHELYRFDLKNNILTRLSLSFQSNHFTSISPNDKYVTYIEGGDANGESVYTLGSETQYDLLTLHVYNCDTGADQVVVQNSTIRGPIAWKSADTMIFGMLDDKEATTNPPKANRPNLYEYNIKTKSLRLLTRDAYLPTLSADGKRIAFWGSEDTEKPFALQENWMWKPHESALIVANADGTGRKAMSRFSDLYPEVLWLPDNRHLLTIHQTKLSPNAEAQIRLWDIEDGTFREIATLKAKDYQALPLTWIARPFRPVAVTSDGNSLMILVNEYTGVIKQAPDLMETATKIQEVNLQTGEVRTICSIKNGDPAWHE